MAAGNETAADTAITSAGVAAAAATFANVVKTAKQAFLTANGSSQQAHQVFHDRLALALATIGFPPNGLGGG